MTRFLHGPVSLALALLFTAQVAAADDAGWISLWDGKTFDGWKASEDADSWSIEDGAIVAFRKDGKATCSMWASTRRSKTSISSAK